MNKRGKIHITDHARHRLTERVPDIARGNVQQFVSAARYKGIDLSRSEDPHHRGLYYSLRHRAVNRNQQHTRYTLYHDMVFVFKGHGNNRRTLVTVLYENEVKDNGNAKTTTHDHRLG